MPNRRKPDMPAREEQRQRGAEKDPADWTTGDEPMTGAQASYLETLAREAGEEVPEELTKAEASLRIEELQEQTGRGDS
jgi:hypothetical protein